MFQDVKDFHDRFQVPMAEEPSLLGPKLYEFRTKFLAEEFKEFLDSHESGDLPQAADALVDLIYVAAGTLLMMGLRPQLHWNIVQDANMLKVPCVSAEDSKRGCKVDIKKPPGWEAPDHCTIIGSGPWPEFDID
jgi:predicted HAD superfamily Cof-like phosphohydrolase